MRSLFFWVFVTFFRLYSKLFLILVIKRNERPDSQCIFIANHPNVFDPMYLLPLLGRRVTVLVTEHAFKIPVFGTLLRYTRQIQVTEEGNLAYAEAVKRLHKGESLLLFPEGDCNMGTKMLPFHTGAVRLAMETHIPIVPIGIYLDPVKIWKRSTNIGKANIVFTWYRYGWYGVTFGKKHSIRGSVVRRSLVRTQTKQLQESVESLADSSKIMCLSAMGQGKRQVKRQFHSVLRFAYRVVCFMFFTHIH